MRACSNKATARATPPNYTGPGPCSRPANLRSAAWVVPDAAKEQRPGRDGLRTGPGMAFSRMRVGGVTERASRCSGLSDFPGFPGAPAFRALRLSGALRIEFAPGGQTQQGVSPNTHGGSVMERASAFPKTPDQICSQWALNEGFRAGPDDRNGRIWQQSRRCTSPLQLSTPRRRIEEKPPWRAGDGRVADRRVADRRVAGGRWALLASPMLDRTAANSTANSTVDRVAR